MAADASLGLMPKVLCYAKFNLTSRQTLKKNRKKLRKAAAAAHLWLHPPVVAASAPIYTPSISCNEGWFGRAQRGGLAVIADFAILVRRSSNSPYYRKTFEMHLRGRIQPADEVARHLDVTVLELDAGLVRSYSLLPNPSDRRPEMGDAGGLGSAGGWTVPGRGND
jgi:hypothetical protein